MANIMSRLTPAKHIHLIIGDQAVAFAWLDEQPSLAEV